MKQKKSKAAQKIKATGGIIVYVLFVVLLALSITSLMVLYIDRLPSNIIEGGIATQDIRADQNYEIIDINATNNLKAEAAKSSLPVYNFDLNLVSETKTRIIESFAKARKQVKEYFEANPDTKKLSDDEQKKMRQNFQLNLGFVLSDSDYRLIQKEGFSEEVEKSIVAILDSIQKRSIIFDKSELTLREDLGIVLRQISNKTDEIKEDVVTDYASILSIEDAKKLFNKDDLAEIQKKYNLEFIELSKFKIALRFAPSLVKANILIDKIETDARKERAGNNVQNIIYKLLKGQTIIRRGDRYEKRHIIILGGIKDSRLQTNIILKFLGVFCLVVLVMLITYAFAYKTIKRFKPSRKDLNFLGLMIILFLAILRLGSFIGSSLQDAVPFTVDITTFYYIIPIAGGAMMVRFILNAEIALIFSIILSFFCGLFLEQNYEITTYYFLSSVMAAYLIGGVEKRSRVFSRGFYIGIINVMLVLSLNLINNISTAATIDFQFLIVNCVFAFFGGVLSALLLLAISPIMEAVFNYTTNIQLLELANMNHPLLREMIVRAPGTHHHSQLVGILAEAGTRVIGGNALLARVGSYYHDIGKMKKPGYFIENQKGVNPHDTLAPSMSALIIEAHVKDGIDMAKEYKLPKVISDFIPEHQGTKLIGFFYHKALKEAEAENGKVDERSYRYKGPKPQTREAGVVMLADTVESAVRSMPDKSPQKIKAMVEKLVNQHFVDGQLDECELTLRDLHLIVDALVKILIGIYHQRVEYPDDNNKPDATGTNNENGKETENNASQSSSKVSNISPLFKEKR